MSRDRFERLAGGTGVVTLDEQEIEGTPRESRAERIVSLLRLLNVLPEADIVQRSEAFGRGAAEGATFGFVDELAGGVASILSPAQRAGLGRLVAPEGQEDRYAEAAARVTYEDVRDTARGQQQRAAEAYPGQFIGGAVAGGLATGRMVPQASAGMTGASRVLANVGQAMGEGVIAGVGGSRAETVQGMAEDAAIGGAIGGGISGGLATLGAAGRGLRAAQRVSTAASDDAARVADAITELERIGAPIEADRIRFKPATLREALAREPADLRAVDDGMAWLEETQRAIEREVIDQGRYMRSGRSALRNLRGELNDQLVRMQRAMQRGEVGEAYAALDQAKRAVGRMRTRVAPRTDGPPNPNTDPQAAEIMTRWYEEVREALEAPEWGGASALQRGDNPAWTAAISARGTFRPRFTERSADRDYTGWNDLRRANRPAVESTMLRATEPAQQDYVDDLVRGVRTRADLVQRLGRHYGSPLAETAAERSARMAAEEVGDVGYRAPAPRVGEAVDSAQVRRAQELAEGVERIVAAARQPTLGRRAGQAIARSEWGSRAAEVADVAGEPLERLGAQASAATSRGVPSAATASTATMSPGAQPVMDDEAELDALLAEDDDEAELEALLGD